MAARPDSITRTHPRFVHAVVADARVTLAFRGDDARIGNRRQAVAQIVRLAWVSDAFAAQCCYRAKARLQALGVPLLPRLLHRLAMSSAQVCIGDPVIIEPGVYIAHGQVVIDGFVTVGSGTVIFPWVTIGLRAGDFQGPRVGRGVSVGTGAKIIGPVTIGRGARIGANAVVVDDVPSGVTAVGMPARWS